MRPGFSAAALFLIAGAIPVWPQSTNADSVVIQDFETRVKDYVKLQKDEEGTLPALKSTVSSGAIAHHEHELAERMRKARRGVVQGNIFTPEIAAEFRRLVGIAMKGSDAGHIQQSLKHAEPIKLALRVGDTWPPGVPLQSTPPTLLMNLPSLTPEVDYRVIGNSLVLRDAKTNLVVDFVPNAVP
jgi:hypothetical protein